MARDQITGKGKMFGHNVIPNSQRKTNRAFKPNLQKKTFVVNGKKVRLTVAASTVRTLKKKGFTTQGSTVKTA
ncbi:50S ribosomal protein L28 [Candidatus Saccharibacteria bacterium]|nr:50S ribosomal protein L28 [Candidatus Saccharibacteria bacterium]MCL1963095.1 50S ribosomal protein L28 [Candidatus Saccharibacteria bacterium]